VCVDERQAEERQAPSALGAGVGGVILWGEGGGAGAPILGLGGGGVVNTQVSNIGFNNALIEP
jgi:hypothetical protein